MTHDPLCPIRDETRFPAPLVDACFYCDLIAKVRSDERSRKGTCWREAADSVEIPPGAIRVYREAGWFWEMP